VKDAPRMEFEIHKQAYGPVFVCCDLAGLRISIRQPRAVERRFCGAPTYRSPGRDASPQIMGMRCWRRLLKQSRQCEKTLVVPISYIFRFCETHTSLMRWLARSPTRK
jgi:hypothetical protein